MKKMTMILYRVRCFFRGLARPCLEKRFKAVYAVHSSKRAREAGEAPLMNMKVRGDYSIRLVDLAAGLALCALLLTLLWPSKKGERSR